MSDAPEYHGPAGAVGAYNKAFNPAGSSGDSLRDRLPAHLHGAYDFSLATDPARANRAALDSMATLSGPGRGADAGRQQNSGGAGVDTKRSESFASGYTSAKLGPWQDSDHDKEAAAHDDGASASLGEKIRQGMGVNPSKYSMEQADYEG